MGSPPHAPDARAARPNIVLVLADDTGYGDLGCYNPSCATPTPQLDLLASEGTRFTDAHSSCALCTPTRYGILTGRYFWRTAHGHSLAMPYDPPVVEPGRLTIASMLKRQGYRTACVGKWHLGLRYPARGGALSTRREEEVDFSARLDGGPVDHGFDEFFGTAGCSTSDAPYCFIRGDRSVGIPSVHSTDDLHALPGFYPGLMVPGWKAEEVDPTFVREAVRFIDDCAGDSGTARPPFFLYLALSAPHNPWLPPDFVKGRSREGPRGDMNALVDWCVGQIRAALEHRGVLDETLLLFTSDNGPMRGQNGHRSAGELRGFKNSPFEGGHRVPLIARWPSRVPAGAVSDELVCLTDLMASLASLTGFALPPDAGEDSHDVLPALLGAGIGDPARAALVCDTGGHRAGVGDFAIRMGRWKLILSAPRDDDPEGWVPLRYLFDLENDPFERENLIDARPTIAREIEQVFGRIRRRGSRFVRA